MNFVWTAKAPTLGRWQRVSADGEARSLSVKENNNGKDQPERLSGLQRVPRPRHCSGNAPDGRQMFIGYFIMGRSENSRNRVFDPVPERGGICTMAADPDKLEDPSLIIYNPVLTLGKTHIVTNGDQTDTIFDLMSQGKSFADALRTRTFEPDGPNYTPRISAVVYADGSYQMSILKSADGNGDSVQRYFFDYPQPVAGEGHFISTYKHNGNPIPSFEGEPLRFACPRTIGDFAMACGRT